MVVTNHEPGQSNQTNFERFQNLKSQELWIWLQKEEEEEAMAMKAAASACKIGGRQRNPSLSSIPLSLQQLKVHQIHRPQSFISAPIHQPGELIDPIYQTRGHETDNKLHGAPYYLFSVLLVMLLI